MSVLGVNSDLAWLQATDHSGEVYICQGLSHTHSALYPSQQRLLGSSCALLYICTHNTVYKRFVLPLSFAGSKGERDLHYFREHLA